MIKLDHIAGLITVAAIVALSLWPLKSHGEDEHEDGVNSGAIGHAVNWSYAGAKGPEYWGDLSPNFVACTSGLMQSPIDIALDATILAVDAACHDYAYLETPLGILDNGHTVQLSYARGSSMSVQAHKYDLVQFHFHAPSEHTVGGKPYPMEAHFVHKDSHGGLAVIGVLIEEGAANEALGEV